jgi:hypothetical protein
MLNLINNNPTFHRPKYLLAVAALSRNRSEKGTTTDWELGALLTFRTFKWTENSATPTSTMTAIARRISENPRNSMASRMKSQRHDLGTSDTSAQLKSARAVAESDEQSQYYHSV